MFHYKVSVTLDAAVIPAFRDIARLLDNSLRKTLNINNSDRKMDTQFEVTHTLGYVSFSQALNADELKGIEERLHLGLPYPGIRRVLLIRVQGDI